MLSRNGLDKVGDAHYLKDTNPELCSKLVYDPYCDIMNYKNLSINNHDSFLKLSYIHPLQLTILTIGLNMKLTIFLIMHNYGMFWILQIKHLIMIGNWRS